MESRLDTTLGGQSQISAATRSFASFGGKQVLDPPSAECCLLLHVLFRISKDHAHTLRNRLPKVGSAKGAILRKLTILLALAGAALFMLPGAAMAAVSGPAIYVGGELYRTVGTPTDFSNTGAPDHSFDTIYDIAGQYNVATAAPGDRDFNGGRWQVHALEVLDLEGADTNESGDLDSAAEIHAAVANGYAIDHGVVRYFECPLIKVPRGEA